jgi:acyl-CoA synthetase (AMP-forming)/AMP-acid ligase II
MSEEQSNFGEVFWRPVLLYPDKVVIEQGAQTLTYAELEERTQRVARLLSDLGVRRDDKVLVLMTNDYRFAECVFGILRVGAVAVPMNIKLGNETLAYIADHSDARVLIAHVDLADKAQAIREATPVIERVLAVGGDIAGATAYDPLLAATPMGFKTVTVDSQDVAMMMYTSGSTGRPKGCLLSHASKWWTAKSGARAMMHDEHDRALITGPLYHANAFWGGMLPMLYVGGSMIILPGFDPVPVLETIHRRRPTFTTGTPSMYSLLLAERETLARCDVTSIELLGCGSAPVPEELMNALKTTFACEVCETYGLTEAGANVLSPRWGIKKLGSTGLPVPDVELRIVNVEDESRDCVPGEVGELWSRGPANALGYYKRPEITAERITSDGWLKTGDLVRADEQGYIYFRGRKDDMINCGGENVYPKEVESILLTHPRVADVAVVPAVHNVKGQAPVAWVVLHRGEKASEDELKQYFLERGPAYAHPRRVYFVDVLPVSGTNKLDRQWLIAETERRLPDGLDSSRP